MHDRQHMSRMVVFMLFMLLILNYSSSAQLEGKRGAFKEAMSVDFDFFSLDPLKIVPPESLEIALYAEIVNIGDETDTYDLFKNEDLPSPWYSSFCIEGGCLRPDLDSLQAFVSLDPMEKETVSIHISTNGEIGGGSVTLTVRSNEEPGTMRSLKVIGITHGTDVLVVDDDGEHDHEQYYTDASTRMSHSGRGFAAVKRLLRTIWRIFMRLYGRPVMRFLHSHRVTGRRLLPILKTEETFF